MFGWLGWERYKNKQKCCKQLREYISCLASYQDSVTEQNEMCREYHQDLSACLDPINRESILRSAQAGSRKTALENQSRLLATDWCKPSSSGFHLG